MASFFLFIQTLDHHPDQDSERDHHGKNHGARKDFHDLYLIEWNTLPE
jgi:hypothetical protein